MYLSDNFLGFASKFLKQNIIIPWRTVKTLHKVGELG